MKNNDIKSKNYLDRKPIRKADINWSADDDGKVTLEIVNKGLFNKIAQALFKKPKISYVHLDEMGSFVWPVIDGEKDITAIGELVRDHFGDKAEPLYERLSKYFQILDSYGFICWNNN